MLSEGEGGEGLVRQGVQAGAAVPGGGGLSRLQDVTREFYDGIFGTNVAGTLFTVQRALPLLNDGGSVILLSSVAAGGGSECFGLYAAAKAAVRSLGRTWANELKGRGIRVNTVSPGAIATPDSAYITGANLHVDGGSAQV